MFIWICKFVYETDLLTLYKTLKLIGKKQVSVIRKYFDSKKHSYLVSEYLKSIDGSKMKIVFKFLDFDISVNASELINI